MTKEQYEEARQKIVARLKELDSEIVTDPMFAELNKIVERQRSLLLKKLNRLEKTQL